MHKILPKKHKIIIFISIFVAWGILSPVLAATAFTDLNSIKLATQFSLKNDIPARNQWGANSGYCGEVSMISAGLYYGQYISQYDARLIASPTLQQNDPDAQLLLGVNAEFAAKKLKLKYNQKVTNSDAQFFTWIKNHVAHRHPVIIGLFYNQFLLNGNANVNAGYDEYDHIVPVVGIGSNKSLTIGYDQDDVILFSDNGSYTFDDGSTPYFYTKNAAKFFKTRQAANAKNADVYSLAKYPVQKYGIAITGVMDTKNETFPVRLKTSINYELPEIAESAILRPVAQSLLLTITVSGLTPGVNYNLYRYTNQSDVPTVDFNANSKKKGIKPWKRINIFTGKVWSITLRIKSSDKVFFRAVKA